MLTGKKLISKQEKDGIHEFILETGSKLGDVFTELPAGIVNKTETGIGATTLEIETNRNSIIVEPVKITASTKAKKHGALYVGSQTRLHPKRVSNKEIKAYLSNSTINPKKIIVVADSLSRVIKCIGESNLQEYFLMIDEADAFQLDSNFRSSMEDCIDIYKLFPPENRCLVTATMLEFSDPELKDDKRSIIKYQNPTTRKIKLVHCDNIIGTTVEIILTTIQKYPKHKILVAYNHVGGCFDIAKHLTDKHGLPKDQVKILCGVGNKDFVNPFFIELDDTLLPGVVNFITSAYFSGFDLDEPYHLITVSDGTTSIFRLSEHRLKQIAGRCRILSGLYSETILYKVFDSKITKQIYSIEELIDAANRELGALKCVESHFSGNKILKKQAVKIRELITKNTFIDKYPFVRETINGENVISYGNIDAFRETQRVKYELYQSENQLPERLIQEGHDLIIETVISKTKVHKQDSSSIRHQKVEEVIKALKDAATDADLEMIMNQTHWNAQQKFLISTFLDYGKYIQPLQLLKLLEEYGKLRDRRKLESLIISILYNCHDSNTPLKKAFNGNFSYSRNYTGKELHDLFNKSLLESGEHKTIASQVKAVQRLKTFLNINRAGNGLHRIIGENPFGLVITQHITGTLEFPDYFAV